MDIEDLTCPGAAEPSICVVLAGENTLTMSQLTRGIRHPLPLNSQHRTLA